MDSGSALETLLQLDTEPVISTLRRHAQILGGFVGVLWVLELIDSLLLGGAFNRYGIRPRQVKGLWGIVLAPLLHGDLQHLAANTIPFLVLGWLILLRGTQDFLIVTAIAWLVSGLGAWLLGGPRTNHLGASGVIFGYFGFLLLRGYFERSTVAIAVAVLAGLLYGGMIWGALPLQRGRSWQGHLFGLIGGGMAARFLPQIQQWLTEPSLN